MSAGRERHEFQVVLTGAFSTGTPLQVRLADYAGFQDAVGERLERHHSGGWSREGVKWRGVSSYGKGAGGYSNQVPLVLVQREGNELKAAAARARRDRPGDTPAGLEEGLDGWRWGLEEVRIQLYDLGVGVVTGVYDAAAPVGMEPGDAERAVYSLFELDRDRDGEIRSSLAAAYEAIARESVEAFRSAVRECTDGGLPNPWLAARLGAPSPSSAEGTHLLQGDVERGRLLWLHPVYVLRGEAGTSAAELEELAGPFRSTYSQAVEYPDGLFVPGIQKSVIVVRGDFALKEEPLRITTLNWAYYALFMEMDRGLLASLDDDRWGTHASLRKLERNVERTYRAFLGFRKVKARLDSALTGLGPRQINLWAAIAEVVRFGELVAGVEGKLEVLQAIAESRVQEAAARSSRRSRNILTGLTALTVVTVVVALVDHLVGTRTDKIGHGELRILFVLLAFLAAAAVYFLAEGDFRRRRRRGHSDRADE